MISKKDLSERDICTKFITPAIRKAGWDIQTQVLEEVSFTDGRILIRGKMVGRGKQKRADYILYYKSNIPVAIVEAKDNKHTVRAGLQQAIEYAQILDIPCVFSSNGDSFLWHDRTATGEDLETEIDLDNFPSPQVLWEKYKQYKGISTEEAERIVLQDYYTDISGKRPRYYQQIAINRTIEAIAKKQNRIMLVMATGTGKTLTAFQIVYRLWKAGVKKRILFLADRKILVYQADKTFDYFKNVKTTVVNRKVDKSYELYFALYQGLSSSEEEKNTYKQFSPDFFDLVIIDECHRGSANEDSAWREILNYFKKATHIGLTATPKETTEASSSEYFGDPIYTYSLKQGIDDGFLAPYNVVRIGLNVDLDGYRPEKGKRDKYGLLVEDRIYNRKDFEKNLVIDERTDLVARKVAEFMKVTDRYSKTIVFCVDIDHAERMRSALARHNADLVKENYKYVMQITGDNEEGKRELDNFINPEERYPVIATTSKLMTTGVDAQTCKIIVLDSNIQSMTEFKQIIGRGTRINEEFGKLYFTILDFRNVTDLFADPQFDGDPIRVKELGEGDDITDVLEDEIDGEPEDIEREIKPVSIRMAGTIVQSPGRKVYVNNVDVSVLMEREMFFDYQGKPVTSSLKDYTANTIKSEYKSLDEFLSKWNTAERKKAIIEELTEKGIPVEQLQNAIGRELDLFDLICHAAYDMPPLTRRDRANNVKKRNYFTKYGEKARQVIEALLEKYADEGVETIEDTKVLNLDPFNKMGTPLEIIKVFGSKEKYLQVIKELEKELYQLNA
ncbi:EcoAI/FtnUII family type I restriction enzme subunit R [Xanthocytophaga agilis]|uniref:DEAD/DEAH box helicase family protein n=1 Tax=Xanthocytophaga agilis TaxID=3048010 RepID=A0AAE3R826_9BACT|nr:DEAD/DEAH box helicase family protein [Xanthocytophaga agilis]MDJ1505586.1 DEAD/DEAH box helicase family protein [Xanthocytophaga agilis]